ncbi:MAG: CotH kinase family protein [Bacteroidota bacterium]
MKALSKLKILIYFFLYFLSSALNAQHFLPDNGPVFLQDEVARIDMYLPEDSFDLMLSNIDYGSSHEFKADFVYTTSFSQETVSNVGFRLRGNTSLNSGKKSFKISFNTFTEEGLFYGVEKLNINGEHNDVSIMRTKLNWEILRELGLTGSRTSYVQMYVNDEYRGLYVNVEHIDEEFIRTYKDQEIGNLYKCLYPSDLNNLGEDPEAYKLEAWGNRVYDLKTNRGEDDYTRFGAFVYALNTVSDENFECEMRKILNVDDYLKYAAFEVLIGHWDGYIVNKNNFYIYENTRTGLIEYIPYDLDNTYGIDWFNVDWANTEIYNWDFEFRPLYERMMENEVFRDQFSRYIQEMLDGPFDMANLTARAIEIQSMIGPFVENDNFYSATYGFDSNDFYSAFNQEWGNHIPRSIGSYLEERIESASNDLEVFSTFPIVMGLRDSIIDNNHREIQFWIEEEFDSLHVTIEENAVVNSHTLFPQEDLFRQSYLANAASDYFEYQVFVFSQGEMYVYPCEKKKAWVSPGEISLTLNELMASNLSTINDEEGEYDDWIELFHSGSSVLDLSNYFLSDDLSYPDKWRLAEENSQPGDFHLVWADKDTEQGPWHANFKLNSNGESLYLVTIEEGSFRIKDRIDFPNQNSDVSFARIVDGTGSWAILPSTPGFSNVISSIELINDINLQIYPNPFSSDLIIEADGPYEFALFDSTGKEIIAAKGQKQSRLSLSHLSSGAYQLSVSTKSRVYTQTLIKQ